jgi:hypothetical protein
MVSPISSNVPSGRTRGVTAGILIAVLLWPAPAAAWGFEVHRFIMDRAIAMLPAAIRPVFERHRDMAAERAIDPDTWIQVGFDDEAPRHFLNLDSDGYGAYPFTALPRAYDAAVKKFGEARVRRNGTLPWRTQDFFDRLVREFEDLRRRSTAGAELDAVRLAAALGHYVADAHVPLHAVVDYDGQKTNQRGVHSRFETALFQRFGRRLTIAPAPMPAIRQPRDFAFEALIAGTRLVPAILEADRRARQGRSDYDTAYYDAFFDGTRTVLERRLNEAIAAVAATIGGAWEQSASRPRP